MKFDFIRIMGVLFVIGTFGYTILAQASVSVEAAQIISIKNSSFHLELDRLKQIVEAGDIKDRQVIIVSIAGPYRTGKSFLLSIFLKYLYAEYKTHNTSDWLDGNINGYFKWRYGRDRTTTGIWIWPDIFTYDFDENNKVAIIIIDTQGIFDHKTTAAESTKIFALTLMLSSIQCYNLMNNIQEDNLQHLEYFTEYGRKALGSIGEKPFQQLLFIVRDWGFGDETGYGLSKTIVEDALSEQGDQMDELVTLRQNIKSSFQEIDAFLMPSPGDAVKRKNFTGDFNEVSSDFKTNVNELVSFILAPTNLKVKTVNGVKIRAGNLVEMLEKYVKLFNGKTLPEPQSIIQMQLELQYAVMLSNAVDLYTKTMEKHCYTETCSEEEFLKLHQVAKNSSLSQFLAKKTPNNGGKDSSIQIELEHQIEEKFKLFGSHNTRNLEKFYMDLVDEGEQNYSNTMKGHLQNKSYPQDEFKVLQDNAKRTSIEQFRNRAGSRIGGKASTFERKLNDKIDAKRGDFDIQNDLKYKEFLKSQKTGQFCIFFERAHAVTDEYGGWCDVTTYCDTYIKLYIDYDHVFTSKGVWDSENPIFNQWFCKENMNKDADIYIELWDSDAGNGNPDDRIFGFETNVNTLLTQSFHSDVKGTNYLYTKSTWVPIGSIH